MKAARRKPATQHCRLTNYMCDSVCVQLTYNEAGVQADIGIGMCVFAIYISTSNMQADKAGNVSCEYRKNRKAKATQKAGFVNNARVVVQGKQKPINISEQMA